MMECASQFLRLFDGVFREHAAIQVDERHDVVIGRLEKHTEQTPRIHDRAATHTEQTPRIHDRAGGLRQLGRLLRITLTRETRRIHGGLRNLAGSHKMHAPGRHP
jgi:hypothetical protein